MCTIVRFEMSCLNVAPRTIEASSANEHIEDSYIFQDQMMNAFIRYIPLLATIATSASSNSLKAMQAINSIAAVALINTDRWEGILKTLKLSHGKAISSIVFEFRCDLIGDVSERNSFQASALLFLFLVGTIDLDDYQIKTSLPSISLFDPSTLIELLDDVTNSRDKDSQRGNSNFDMVIGIETGIGHCGHWTLFFLNYAISDSFRCPDGRTVGRIHFRFHFYT